MKLDAWLRQDNPLEESLRVIECLCQAVNEVHDRGNAVGGLEPDRIEVGSDGHCDLSAASQGSPSPDYAAPDAEADAPTAADDVYSVGAITWEILAGQAAGASPRHLAEVRPDLPRELADAITACLERSADWRPKDLTYLAQVAATRPKGAGARTPDARRGRGRRKTPARTRSQQRPRRTWPLLAALVVVLGLAAFAGRQYLGIGGAPGAAPPQPSEPSSATPTPTPVLPPVTEPTPATPPATDAPTALPGTDATTRGEIAETAAPDTALPDRPPSDPGPASAPVAEPAAPAPVAPPPPATSSAPAALPPTSMPAGPPTPSQPAAPPEPAAPSATVVPRDAAPVTSSPGQSPPPDPGAQAAPSIPAPPPEPAVLTVVSPLEVKRPGKVMLDLRGQGFSSQHRAQVLPVKKAPQGIRIVGQKRVSDSLITVLVELSEAVDPGDYGIAVEDGHGGRTEALVFKVTK